MRVAWGAISVNESVRAWDDQHYALGAGTERSDQWRARACGCATRHALRCCASSFAITYRQDELRMEMGIQVMDTGN